MFTVRDCIAFAKDRSIAVFPQGSHVELVCAHGA